MAAAESKRARKKEEQSRTDLEEENRRKENLFNLRYHQDITERTDYLNAMRKLREDMDAQQSQNEAKGITMGDTKEQQVAEQDSLNKAYADSVANYASNASVLKDGVLEDYGNDISKYYDARRKLNSQMADIHQNTSNQWAQTATNAMATTAMAAGVAAGAADGMPKKSKVRVGGAQNVDLSPGSYDMGGGVQVNPDGTITNSLNPMSGGNMPGAQTKIETKPEYERTRRMLYGFPYLNSSYTTFNFR